MLVVYAVIAAILAMFPADAFAWGPGMHVELAMGVLAKLALVSPLIRGLIKCYPEAFIYGAASPDIIVGKKYAGLLHHCHSWRMGYLILNEAATDRQKAAAYGYLMHLAADVVAHNYFIPVKIIRSYRARVLTHTYWEMRFDLGVGDAAWKKLKQVTETEIQEFDALLERVLRKTLFSFQTNKRIFNTILMLQKMKTLRGSLKVYAKRSRFDIPKENREHYHELASEAVMDIMSHPKSAGCLEMDPVGTEKLKYAKDLRDRIRQMLLYEFMDDAEAEKLVELAKEELAVGLYRPDLTLPDVMDVIAKG